MNKRTVFIMVLVLWSLPALTLSAADGTQEEKIADLDRRVGQLEANHLSRQVADTAEGVKPPVSTDFRFFWKDGFRMESADGEFTGKIGGRVMNDWSWVNEDSGIRTNIGPQANGTEFRRARLYMEGEMYGNVEYKLQVDFAGGDVDMKDAYLGLLDLPVGKLRAGHFKEPFSLEELTSSKYTTFVERALPNALAPSRNVGIMLHDTALASSDPRMTWAVGLFRDTDDYGDTQDDGGYNVTGRVTWLPHYEEQGASLVHVGVAASHRQPNGNMAQYRSHPEVHLTDYFIDTGSFGSDKIDLVGLEGAWVEGPVSVQGEYVYARAAVASSANFNGYYVQASYFLTGEHRKYKPSSGTFDRVKPKENFAKGGGTGAWEAAVRVSGLELNDGSIASGGKLTDVTTGLNWYLNPNVRIMWNYIHADQDQAGQADLLSMRFQVDF